LSSITKVLACNSPKDLENFSNVLEEEVHLKPALV
jgi:hypothetical protein